MSVWRRCCRLSGWSAYSGGMQSSSRAAVAVAFAVAPLLMMAGCGGTTAAGPDATLARIQPTSFVEIPPATTTTTTTLPPDAEGPGLAQGEQTYTVQPNDGFGKIAALHDISVEQLINYNQFDGIDTVIVPGQEIKIPPGASIPGSQPETADAGGESDSADDSGDTDDSASSGECPTTYTIKAGDNTRIGVADQFGITFEQMDAANANTPGYENFVVGTDITIPCP